MRGRRGAAWLLIAALVLAGCGGEKGGETGGAESPSPAGSIPVTVPVTPSPSLPAPPATQPAPTPTPEEPPQPTPTPTPEEPPQPPSWEEGRTLDREGPDTYGGLELPIRGATGYASVEMGLWREPLPSPEPTPEETVPANPEPSPSETVPANPEPSPSETVPASQEPLPSGSAPANPEPSPSETVPASQEPLPSGSAPVSLEPPPIETIPASPEPAPVESVPASPEPAPVETIPASPEPTPTEPPDPYEGALAVLEPGDAFTVLREEGDWWKVAFEGQTGWVEHRLCMVNLPDVIPSMLYDAINSYSARYVSCGKPIPGVTGEAFYTGKVYNPRLSREEYLMPMLYAAAKKVCAAQRRALAEGNCLKVYEAFRPRSTQLAVVEGLTALSRADEEVKAGVTTPPWSMTYFINTGISNHQRGIALDVSLVKVQETEERWTGEYRYLKVKEYEEYEMPTPMHELSMAAASTLGPGSTTLAESMNEPAIGLRGYFTKVGMSPLESEWWHFNDFGARNKDKPSTGEFEIVSCLSETPS